MPIPGPFPYMGMDPKDPLFMHRTDLAKMMKRYTKSLGLKVSMGTMVHEAEWKTG